MSLIEIKDLRKWFDVQRGLKETFFPKTRKHIKAVDGVSFAIKEGEIFGLVGESGCGKTTTTRVLMRLEEKTSGEIYFQGHEISNLKGKELKEMRSKMQIVFQNPYESLEPRTKIKDALSRPLKYHHITNSEKEEMERMEDALTKVDLTPPSDFINRHPYELSGGQLQRISVARALILKPSFLAMDEPVSMLDVSIRAGVLKMLLELKKELNMTYLFITHDISLVKFICDRVAVMYLGKIAEIGPAGDVLMNPKHPYTKALREVLPSMRGRGHYQKVEKVIRGEVPSPIDIPSGCIFHPRCVYAKDVCRERSPKLVEIEKDHFVACNLLDSAE
jgi:peptide/nickel transport system ATP-binding protein